MKSILKWKNLYKNNQVKMKLKFLNSKNAKLI